jgi:hypothetical protein
VVLALLPVVDGSPHGTDAEEIVVRTQEVMVSELGRPEAPGPVVDNVADEAVSYNSAAVSDWQKAWYYDMRLVLNDVLLVLVLLLLLFDATRNQSPMCALRTPDTSKNTGRLSALKVQEYCWQNQNPFKNTHVCEFFSLTWTKERL